MDRADLSDADLVAESLGGDRDAFGHIVERYQTLVASLAYCATGNASQSEDLAQETFVTAWKQLAALREPAKLRSWLCGITRFLIGKELRRQGREPVHEADSLDTLDECTSPEPLPPDHAISQEEMCLLWRSLERIPPAYREPLVLFYREHQSIEAVARGLGLSEDAVKQRLSRGRKFLQEQFMAFVAGALDQTRPGKTFAIGVLAALPVLAVTAKGATAGTTLAKHGSVAAKATSTGGFLQLLSYVFMGMVGWVAGALSLGGYIGYKMGGDRQHNEWARRSVATFWRIMGISMSLLFGLPIALILIEKVIRIPGALDRAASDFLLNVCLPAFMFGVVPSSLVIWIWQRRRRTAPGGAIGGSSSGQAPKSGTVWVMLAMASAIAYLGYMCWIYSGVRFAHIPKPLYLSTTEIAQIISNPQVRKYRFKLYQSASGIRRLSGDLLEDGKVSPFYAPADSGTVTLLAQKGINYETEVEHPEAHPHPRMTYAALWAWRLLNPFCCFILVAGAITLLRGSHPRAPRPAPIADLRRERRVDKAFAAFASCGLIALAVFRWVNTDWNVRAIFAYEVPAIAAQHRNARFEVFEYWDGSKKLWISDRRTPDFIAPATEATLGELTRQGITYQTYLSGRGGRLGPSRISSALWLLAFGMGAGGLLWWALRAGPRAVGRAPDRLLGLAPGSKHAFTLIELLVVMAIISILASLLLSSVSAAKARAITTTCLNNQRQLGVAWTLYASEWGDRLPLNFGGSVNGVHRSPPGSWVTGNAACDADPATITQGTLFPYAEAIQLYHCPADHTCVAGTSTIRLRSISLSIYMGGEDAENDFLIYPIMKLAEIPHPSKTLTFLDEDENGINEGIYLYASKMDVWMDTPGRRHQTGLVLDFADNHSEYWKWKGPKPLSWFNGGYVNDPAELEDLKRLQQTAPDAE
ncbi:MAG TPA: RNA polymerase sigma factor [Candidatus Acidoferrum sp.]|nr:RNA polymerase sigma factor [Candidatus Acidoferrum sp.]